MRNNASTPTCQHFLKRYEARLKHVPWVNHDSVQCESLQGYCVNIDQLTDPPSEYQIITRYIQFLYICSYFCNLHQVDLFCIKWCDERIPLSFTTAYKGPKGVPRILLKGGSWGSVCLYSNSTGPCYYIWHFHSLESVSKHYVITCYHEGIRHRLSERETFEPDSLFFVWIVDTLYVC